MKVLLAILMVLVSSVALAKEVSTKNGAWKFTTSGKGKERLCYIYSFPEKSDQVERKNPYIMLTSLGSDKFEFSANAGFAIKENQLIVKLDDKNKYSLFTKGALGWFKDQKDDKEIVARLKAGNRLEVLSVTKAGKKVVDIYSLEGFTASLNDLKKACGAK